MGPFFQILSQHPTARLPEWKASESQTIHRWAITASDFPAQLDGGKKHFHAKPPRHKHPFPLSPDGSCREHGMQGTGGGCARQQGGFHHLQDIRHRMMQSQWQRQKQCQIHSLLTIVWQQPPQRTPLCTLLMPSAYRPPCSRPGFTRCNPYTAAAAKWARPRKYLIGTLFLAYHNASGCLRARLRCLDFRIIAWKSERNCIFLPPAPIGSPYVRLRASDYNKREVWISRKLACTGEKMTANEHAGSSSAVV